MDTKELYELITETAGCIERLGYVRERKKMIKEGINNNIFQKDDCCHGLDWGFLVDSITEAIHNNLYPIDENLTKLINANLKKIAKSITDDNSGGWNSGDGNSGDRNLGDRNSGYGNSGYGNSGNRNSGNGNSGYRNSGDGNSGDRNSGYRNSGNWNSGNWNKTNYSSGFFNSKDGTVRMFNKDSGFSRDEFYQKITIPACLHFDLTEWVSSENMTDKEKKNNPKYETAGGYLKTLTYKEASVKSISKATDKEKGQIRALPNYDPDVFEEIFGIRI